MTSGVPQPQRFWAAFTVLAGIAAAVLDSSMINVALPTIGRELNVSPAQSIWVVNAYLLTVAICLLPLASLGELVSYRRVYVLGSAIFTVGSLACMLVPSLPLLIAARVLQGMGAAGMMAVTGALVRFIYPPSALGRGISYNAVVVSVSTAAGPTVAALVLALGSWKSLFAINMLAGLLVFALGIPSLPSTPARNERFDVRGALLTAVTICLLVLGCDRLGDPHTRMVGVLLIAVSAALGAVLVRHQTGRRRPLLPVDLLRIKPFALAIGTSFCSFAAQITAFVAMPFLLELHLHRSQYESGLLITPWAVATGITTFVAGRLSDRYPAGVLVSVGLSLLCAGLLAVGLLTEQASALDVVWRTALCGVGFGLFQVPNNRSLLLSAPSERSGGASGMQAVTRTLAHTIGTAAVAVLFQLDVQRGAQLALFMGALLAAIGTVISLQRLR